MDAHRSTVQGSGERRGMRGTDEEIVDDPHRVLAVIERLLVKRRHDEGNLL